MDLGFVAMFEMLQSWWLGISREPIVRRRFGETIANDSSKAALSILVAHARDKPPRMFQITYAK